MDQSTRINRPGNGQNALLRGTRVNVEQSVPTRLTHISFATWQMGQSAEGLVSSAYAHGVDNLWVYSPSHPAFLKAISENPEIANEAKGSGYWIWKAYILLDAMDQLADGELLFYTDAGISYIRDPKPIFALAEEQDVVLFNIARLPGTHRYLTKRDALVLLGADNPQNWDERLVQSGMGLYRANQKTRAFVREWLDGMRDPRVLTDMPNCCGLGNFPEFQTHGHDMSVMTVIAKRHGIRRTRWPGIPPRPEDEGDYPQILYRHTLRNFGAPHFVSAVAAAEVAKRDGTPAFLYGGPNLSHELIRARARETYERWRDRERMLPSDFDPKIYLSIHPDVAVLDIDPVHHYLEWGIKRRLYRLPPDYDEATYLHLNPDVAFYGKTATLHYATLGHLEGRRYRSDEENQPNGHPEAAIISLDHLPPGFDDATYLSLNPDVAEARMNARFHYTRFGYLEDRKYLNDENG
jgi:hypothetical protein